MSADALAIVGLIRNAQGIRGEVVVEPLTDAPDAVFVSGRRVFAGAEAKSRAEDRSLTVGSSRPFKGGVMVKFDEVANRNEAELLRGLYLFSPFDELEPPTDNEVYLHELIGMAVKLDTGERAGEIIGYYELPQGLTLEAKTVRGSVLIPYRPEVVRHVDREGRELVVRADLGLFD